MNVEILDPKPESPEINPEMKQKVLLVVRPTAGGMLRHVQGLLRYLPEYHYEATLIGPDFITDRPNPFIDRKAVLHLRKQAEGFPLIHAHGVRAGWLCAWAFRGNVPWLWTVHHLLLQKSVLVRAVWRWISKHARKVISVSNSVQKGLIEGGVPASGIEVVPGGIDLSRFEKLPDRALTRERLHIDNERPVILAAGRFIPEKGYDLLIRAMETVWSTHPNTDLWFAGEGPENTRLVQRTAGSSRPGQVRFFGYWSYITELYASADVLAVPSRQAGLGSAVMEAMVCGLPVVATGVEQFRQMIEHERTGLLTPPENPQALGEAISRLFTDRTLAAQIAQNARGERERFDIHHMVKRTAEIYGEYVPRNA
jgi:glycosyltransferase involved in cell wall biosynthesis